MVSKETVVWITNKLEETIKSTTEAFERISAYGLEPVSVVSDDLRELKIRAEDNSGMAAAEVRYPNRMANKALCYEYGDAEICKLLKQWYPVIE